MLASGRVGSVAGIRLSFRGSTPQLPGSSRLTGKPHLTACCPSRHTSADRWIWQSRPLPFKWQDWVASGGGISSYRWQDNSESGIPPAAAFHCKQYPIDLHSTSPTPTFSCGRLSRHSPVSEENSIRACSSAPGGQPSARRARRRRSSLPPSGSYSTVPPTQSLCSVALVLSLLYAP
jgi:hypothetical protein